MTAPDYVKHGFTALPNCYINVRKSLDSHLLGVCLGRAISLIAVPLIALVACVFSVICFAGALVVVGTTCGGGHQDLLGSSFDFSLFCWKKSKDALYLTEKDVCSPINSSVFIRYG